ncbi:citrate transporter [Staphylococcus aureus]|uniref:Citrate transporter n=1 Tax=Staphylococcus aureus TaxID=1280 RepID=A0A380DRI8_STAAU|nr:citrate transporter [Staphylococcus aureus]
MMAAVIIAAGMFLGVLNETGMLKAIADEFNQSDSCRSRTILAYYCRFTWRTIRFINEYRCVLFAVLPIVEQTAGQFGVPSVSTAYSMVIGNIIGTFVSPFHQPYGWQLV